MPEEEAGEETTQNKLLKPHAREVVVGVGERAVKIGGKLAMYRHECTYVNPTAIAIDVTDEMSEHELHAAIKRTEAFSFERAGQTLKLDMIAVRSTSNDPERFKTTVKKVAQNSKLPLILCSTNPEILEAGLMTAPQSRPLLYAATKNNWKETGELALTYNCPLVASAPNDLQLLRSLAKTLLACGVEDIVLDPGTFLEHGLAETLNNFTMIRRAACEKGDELLGFPLMGVPLIAWIERDDAREEIVRWREAYLAAMLVARFADVLIIHNLDGWALLPLVMLRQDLHADPKKQHAGTPKPGWQINHRQL
jgi:acetyl-CoA decarbonylase/synthase complex subunit gamma